MLICCMLDVINADETKKSIKDSVVSKEMRTFAIGKQWFGLSLAPIRCGRKVRAAQGVPLVNMQAIGNSRAEQKKITAMLRVW